METPTHAGLGLLASAIAGRTVAIADSAHAAWTDGEIIYLPNAASHHDAVQAVALQASLIAAGSLAPEILRPLARSRTRARRYLAIEGHRALAAHESLLPPVARRLIDHTARSDSPAASLAMCGATDLEPPKNFGVLRPRLVLHEPIATVSDDDTDGEDLSDVLSSLTVGRGGPIGRLLARMLQLTRGGSRRSGAADAPTHATWSGAVDAGGEASFGLSPANDDVRGDHYGLRYPEWDVDRGQYRHDWCTVIEAVATKEAAPPARHGDHALRRALSRLEVGLTPVRRRAHGDDVDIDAAVESLVNARAGVADSGDVYIESLRRRRDLSVLVLLDVSGSAGEPGGDGQSVHDHQRRLAATLTTALYGLGDHVALYAFNSRGKDAVQMTRVVEFGSPVDATTHRRLAGLTPVAYTRLGAAIRHATTVLTARAGTPRRLLVVISDGFAYDNGYEGRYGEADARRALAEARRRGVGCACISVGTDADDDALRRVFGTATHASIPRTEQAARYIGPLFRTALRVADAQRRAFERRRTQ